MKILYQAILNTLSANKQAFADAGLQPPVFIDLYDSQPEIPDQFEFICPAIFIDYSIAWEKKGTQRIGTLTVELHVLTDATPETSNISARLPEGLKKIDYYETVVNLIEGIATEETSALTLYAERPISTDYFNYHLLTFTCTISRKVNTPRLYTHGSLENIIIQGNPKQRKTFDLE